MNLDEGKGGYRIKYEHNQVHPRMFERVFRGAHSAEVPHGGDNLGKVDWVYYDSYLEARAYVDDSGLLTFGALSPLGSRIRSNTYPCRTPYAEQENNLMSIGVCMGIGHYVVGARMWTRHRHCMMVRLSARC